jgi:hypothetical protein
MGEKIMTTRETLFARYKTLDALVTADNAFSEPLYTLRMTAWCDYLLADPYFDWSAFILFQYGPTFAQLPLLPATCPVKETGRIQGVIGFVCASYGYIRVEGGDDVKFYPRHVFGRVPMKGDLVTFERGIAGNALNVVLEGAQTSREAYSAKMAQRPAVASVRRGRANFGEGFKFTENLEELKAARGTVRKLGGG